MLFLHVRKWSNIDFIIIIFLTTFAMLQFKNYFPIKITYKNHQFIYLFILIVDCVTEVGRSVKKVRVDALIFFKGNVRKRCIFDELKDRCIKL